MTIPGTELGHSVSNSGLCGKIGETRGQRSRDPGADPSQVRKNDQKIPIDVV